ncbi:MAG: UDP-3-O-(3-hydroxymyristoyl)glucosamine N-acyltransferase, partial [Planctomycetota bacterium]
MTSRTLTEIAELCGADLDGDGARKVVGPSSLVDAEEHHVSFFSDPRYRGQLVSTKAAGVLVPTGFELDEELKRQISGEGGRDLTLLRVEDPSGAFTTVIESFAAPLSALPVGAHPSALVDESAKIGEGVAIGPNVVIGPHVVLEDNVILHAGVFVGEATCIGRSTVCHPNVTLYPRTVLGAKCILHAGVVVGSDGFGFEPTAEGWDKIPQCGSVEVEDDVEIGAGSTIDRGRFGATR